jgi:hypothetical protein
MSSRCLFALEWIEPLPPLTKAEKAGIEFAQKWIDDGKPDF